MGGGRSNAGRPKLAIRLMASLLYLKNSFNLSDEKLVVRWSANILCPVAVLQRAELLRSPPAMRRYAGWPLWQNPKSTTRLG
jgi:hypothetical protein